MQFHPQDFRYLSWQQLESFSNIKIKTVIRNYPKYSLETLISDINTSHVTTFLANRVCKALNHTLVPRGLFERLTSLLIEKNILSKDLIEQFAFKQSFLEELEEALKHKSSHSSIISLVKQGQTISNTSPQASTILEILCKSPEPRHENVTDLMIQLAIHHIYPGTDSTRTVLLDILCKQPLPWNKEIKQIICHLIKIETQLPSPVPNPQELLTILCEEMATIFQEKIQRMEYRFPRNPHLLNAAVFLVESKQIPSDYAIQKLLLARNYGQYFDELAIDLVRKMTVFSNELLTTPNFFLLLCQQVSKNDESLYPIIRQFIEKNENCDIQDNNQIGAFDYFIKNGGNLVHLFKELKNELLLDRSLSYENTPEEFYASLSKAEMLFILYNKQMRAKFLQAKSLEFLQDSLLIALAQYSEEVILAQNNEKEMNTVINVMKKLCPLQQETFLNALPHPARKCLQTVFVSQENHLEADLKFLKEHANILLQNAKTFSLSRQQTKKIKQLVNSSSILPSSHLSKSNKKSLLNLTAGKCQMILSQLQDRTRTLARWTNNPLYTDVLQCFADISKYQMQLSPNLKIQAQQKSETELTSLRNLLGNTVFINLKYEIARNHAQALPNPIEEFDLDEMDWDKLVSKLFDDITIANGCCPSQKSDEQDAWKYAVKEHLEKKLSETFARHNITSLKALYNWAENKRSIDEVKDSIPSFNPKKIKFETKDHSF